MFGLWNYALMETVQNMAINSDTDHKLILQNFSKHKIQNMSSKNYFIFIFFKEMTICYEIQTGLGWL